MRLNLALLCLLLPLCALAQPSDPATEGATAGEPAAEPATSPAPAPVEAAPPPAPETCRSLTDKGMATDLKALTAQTQKLETEALLQLHSASEAFWTDAVERCEGRAKDRAQRNLLESQKAAAILKEQLSDGPECAAAHKDASTLQEMARTALGERRWIDAATIFHKSEDMWDLAAERCNGTQKALALKRLEQSELDGYNAEFCAPLFDRAREQTQKLRAGAAAAVTGAAARATHGLPRSRPKVWALLRAESCAALPLHWASASRHRVSATIRPSCFSSRDSPAALARNFWVCSRARSNRGAQNSAL